MSRNATLVYKDKPTDIRRVGKDLNVRYVVEGTIQRSDQNVRVTAQLTDANTGRQLWADRYDREAPAFAVRVSADLPLVCVRFHVRAPCHVASAQQ
jgi:TolB-like protein